MFSSVILQPVTQRKVVNLLHFLCICVSERLEVQHKVKLFRYINENTNEAASNTYRGLIFFSEMSDRIDLYEI